VGSGGTLSGVSAAHSSTSGAEGPVDESDPGDGGTEIGAISKLSRDTQKINGNTQRKEHAG